MRYRKRQVFIDAAQWTGDNLPDIEDLTGGECREDTVKEDGLKIFTGGGQLNADTGDFIIRFGADDFYLCKQETFHAVYELAE